jgi:lipoprotein-anchoring transpeptidase ErfK/SrfK
MTDGKWIGRRRRHLLVLSVAGLALLGGCTGTADSGGATAGEASPEASAAPAPVSIELVPGDGLPDFPPGEPIVATATHGDFSEVTLTGADGTVVSGSIEPGGGKWRANEKLGYDKTYTLSATAVGPAGKPETATSTFTTAAPQSLVSVSMNVEDGATVGAGMPLIFTFSGPITDRAAAEEALRVTSEPRTEGGFHWFSDQRVIWRPKEYWQPGTSVSVNAAVYGIDLGDGTFGRQDRAADITIGDKLVAVADGSTHELTVSVNGREVRTMPISMGKESHPTPHGTYTVMREYTGYTMDSSTYGVPVDAEDGYRLEVDYAVRLSNSGIFYHSAPWSVEAQGERDVSHGCINLSTEDARWLMETSKVGDLFVVRNSGGEKLEPTDGWSVWQMSWEEWQSDS